VNPDPSDTGLGVQAYREIWKRIVHLEYPPLAVLKEAQLSEELGIGLAPIRQALRRLEYDGLVMILPRRGTLTTEVGLNSIQWELEIRVELEGLAARLAAKRGSEAQRAELREIMAKLEEVYAEGATYSRMQRFTDLDGEFHRNLYLQTHNPSLISDLERHFAHSLRIWFYRHRSAPTVVEEASMWNYREIVAALEERDADRAEAALRWHIMHDTERVLTELHQTSTI